MFKIVFEYCEYGFSLTEDILDFNNYDYNLKIFLFFLIEYLFATLYLFII